MAEDKKNPLTEKYPNLKGIFFTGSLKGQVNSIFRDLQAKPDKAADFVRAVEAGDIALGTDPLPRPIIAKLVEIGVKVPKTLLPAD